MAEYRRKKGTASVNDPYFWIHAALLAAAALAVAYLAFSSLF